MPEIKIMQDLLIILSAAFIGGNLAKMLKFPILLGYLLAGFFTSIYFSGKIFSTDDLTIIGNIGITLLLFTLGLELSFKKLLRIGRVAIVGSVLQILLMAVLGLLFLPKLFGFEAGLSLFLSLAFSLSSTAVVVKILEERGELGSIHGEILSAWLLVQDLAVVPMLLFLPYVLKAQAFDLALLLSILISTVKASAIIIGTYFVGKRILSPFAHRFLGDIPRELFLTLTILLVLSSTLLFTKLGLPGPVGAFLAGLLISHSSRWAVFSEIRPFRDLFSTIFFVLLGMMLAPSFLFLNIPLVFQMFVLITVFKFVSTILIMLPFRFHTKIVFLTASSLPNVGEFAYVLAGTFLASAIISRETYNLVLSVSLISLFATPIEISLAPSVYSFFKKTLKKHVGLYNLSFGRFDFDKNYLAESLSSHVVICGHGRVGKEISLILLFAKIPFVVIDFNKHALDRLKEQGVPTLYGDPADFDILDNANTREAKALIIALPDRRSQELIIQNALRLNPRLFIICRSHFDEDRITLLSKGANIIVQPEFEAGVSMARQALSIFGRRDGEIDEFIGRLKRGLGI